MQRNGRIFPPRLLGIGHIAVDDSGVFTVHHQRQPTVLEDLLKRFLTVNKHIACRRPHKKLDTRYAGSIKLTECINIIIGSTIEKGIVDVTLLTSKGLLLCQRS